MTSELWWIYAFNVIVNSLFAFCTIALLVQLLISGSRVKQPRMLACLLCIPLLKLAVDPFLYDFGHWALAHQVNLFAVEAGSRMLSVLVAYSTSLQSISDLIPFTTGVRLFCEYGQLTFAPADLLALSLPLWAVKAIVLTVVSVALMRLIGFFACLGSAANSLSELSQGAYPCLRPVLNAKLRRKLQRVHLLQSAAIQVPCAFGVVCKHICFPDDLVDQLSQEEFEAVIAHELAHLRWHDGVVRLFCSLYQSVFWWLPTSWWVKRIECAQERACDARVSEYGIANLDLASAIIKTARMGQDAAPVLATCFAQGSLSKRLQALLKDSPRRSRLRGIQIGFVTLLAVSIALGRFWIF